jgi:hypothetical protein
MSNLAPENLHTVLKNGHFVAAKVPVFLGNDPLSQEMKRQLDVAREDFLLPIKPGCWLFSEYHVPNDIAIAGAESFNWDNIYVVPEQYAFHLDVAVGSHIRYGLPVGEEFVSPKKRQYYGHPALYDLETGKTIKNICDARKRGLKKTYEMNQLRIKNIETSVFDFKNYNISHNYLCELGNGESKLETPLDSPSAVFSQDFNTRLFNEEPVNNRRLFRRSIGAEMGMSI